MVKLKFDSLYSQQFVRQTVTMVLVVNVLGVLILENHTMAARRSRVADTAEPNVATHLLVPTNPVESLEVASVAPAVTLEHTRPVKLISVRLSNLFLLAQKNKQGDKLVSAKVSSLRGGDSCLPYVYVKDDALYIEEKNGSSNENCLYSVLIESERSAPLEVASTGYARLELSQWSEPVQAILNRGLVGFAELSQLSVQCKSCDISGQGVSQRLEYNTEAGTVGVMDLAATVKGQSAGDVALVWRRVPQSLEGTVPVQVRTKAGDVNLFFPRTAPLSFDVQAPRGEVHSRVDSHPSGIPVQVNTDVGTIRLTHLTVQKL